MYESSAYSWAFKVVMQSQHYFMFFFSRLGVQLADIKVEYRENKGLVEFCIVTRTYLVNWKKPNTLKFKLVRELFYHM